MACLARHAVPARRRAPASSIVAALVLGAALAGADDAAAAADGSAAFEQYCIACHGADARGIDNLGADLVASAFVRARSTEELVAFLEAGRLADDPASRTGRPMPGFGWVTAGELKALAEYLKSINTPGDGGGS
jgi:mono/diheme cytochrome c family protein